MATALAHGVDAQLIELAEIMADPMRYAETFLHIRDKYKKLRRFRANAQQRRLYELKRTLMEQRGLVRVIILKARQMGVTTWEQLDSYHMVAREDGGGDGMNVMTLAHDTESTETIFRIALRCYDTMDPEFRPERKSENRRELYFPHLDSWFGIRTAGAKAGGRGSTLSKVHGSEVAQWPRALEIHEALNEAVPIDGGVMVYESTAFGAAGLFYDTWQQAKEANGIVTLNAPYDLVELARRVGHGGRSLWVPVFFPWFEFPEYAVPLLEPDELGTLSDAEEALVETYGLTHEQLKFRRLKIADYQGKEPVFDQEYPTDDVTCFLLSGRRIFDVVALKAALADCTPPVREFRWFGATVKVWEEWVEGRTYIIGSDSSEGVQGGDYSSIDVLCRETLEQVATVHGYLTPHEHARVLAWLGRGKERDEGGEAFRGYWSPKHGPALLVPEVNNTGHAVVSTLLHELKYPRSAIYHRLTHYADPDKEREWKPGWLTDSATRWIMLDDLGDAIAKRSFRINDEDTVKELLAFQLGDDGKPAAPEGAHDDRVISIGVTLQGLKYNVAASRWKTTTGDADQHARKRSTW